MTSHGNHGEPKWNGDDTDYCDPGSSCPHVNSTLHNIPICAVSEEGENLCAAETEHEEKGGEDVDPEVDHDHHGEDVYGLVALRAAVDPDQPDRPSYQPGDLEDDVDWKHKYNNIVESF